MSRPIAELRRRARSRYRTRPLDRVGAARIVAISAAGLFGFIVAITAAMFLGLEVDPEDPTELDPETGAYAWIPLAGAAVTVLGTVLFALRGKRAWRVGALMLLLAFAAAIVGSGVAAIRDPPEIEGPEDVFVFAGILLVLPVTGIVAVVLDARRRLRQDRFR